MEKKIYIFEKPKDKTIPTTSKKTTVAKNKAKKEKNLETDKLILATIKKLKQEGKHDAAKVIKLTCNNNFENSSDILKK